MKAGYAYGARFYDPAIARFTGVDPISDRFAWVSTYNYAENAPINSIDLHGLQKYVKIKEVGTNSEGQFTVSQQTVQQTDEDGNTNLTYAKYANQDEYGTRGTLTVTINVENGKTKTEHKMGVVDRVMSLFDSSSDTEKVDGGLAGSAENGGGMETRINENAENVELDEFTSGNIPKHPAGQAAAAARFGTKVGGKILENKQNVDRGDRRVPEPADSSCLNCGGQAHYGNPYVRYDQFGEPIDTIQPK